MQASFLKINFEQVYLVSQIENSVFVYLTFDSG